MGKKKDAIQTRDEFNSQMQSIDDLAVSPGVTTYDAESFSARVRHAVESGAEVRDTVALQPGQGVTGVLLGEGPQIDYMDPAGDEKKLRTWSFRVQGGMILDVLSATQLDDKLPALVGCTLEIIRAGQEDTKKGRRVNRYAILKLADPE